MVQLAFEGSVEGDQRALFGCERGTHQSPTLRNVKSAVDGVSKQSARAAAAVDLAMEADMC